MRFVGQLIKKIQKWRVVIYDRNERFKLIFVSRNNLKILRHTYFIVIRLNPIDFDNG